MRKDEELTLPTVGAWNILEGLLMDDTHLRASLDF